jgi:chondroitin 4-sulfotransferase 11
MKDILNKLKIRAYNLELEKIKSPSDFILLNLLKFYSLFYNLFKNNICILEKNKAIYIPIEKVANTSLKRAFYYIENNKVPKKIHVKNNFKNVSKEKLLNYGDYFKFTFVRNPYDRLVSCYFNKIKHNPNLTDKSYYKGVHRGLLKNSKNFNSEMDFKSFVKEVSKIKDNVADVHIRSQYTFITTKRGDVPINYIGKFENLEKDYKKVCEKICVNNPPNLSKENKSNRNKDYRKYYDEEIKKLVKQRYKKDLKLFNYKF